MPFDRLVRALSLRPGEPAILGWAWLYVLALMASYYVIRPIRDAMGVEGGVEHLQWLFTGTLVAMLALQPAYAALVRRLPRQRFITWSYAFFIANLLGFAWLIGIAEGDTLVWVGRAFFIWVSVFNLFVVSLFWALMVDLFDPEQSKRLFGLLAAGATVGAMSGSALTSGFVARIGGTGLLIVSACLLLVAIGCVGRIIRLASGLTNGLVTWGSAAPAQDHARNRDPGREQAAIGGTLLAGLTHTLRSPYLLNIALYILLYTVTSTFLYFQQAAIVRDAFPDRTARTAFFANIDLIVNAATLLVQLFLTGRLLRWFGVAFVASVLPAVTLIGFGALAAAPTLAVFVVVQVARRVGNFGLSRPTREVLFTVVPREDKYKAKSFIDTVVYRAGDQVGSWSYTLLAWIGAGPAGIALAALPIAATWLANGWWLGRRQRVLAAEASADPGMRP